MSSSPGGQNYKIQCSLSNLHSVKLHPHQTICKILIIFAVFFAHLPKMRLFLITLLLVGAAVARKLLFDLIMTWFLIFCHAFPEPGKKVKGTCPRGSGGIGICVFNPEINCTGDEACSDKGQLCCPDGCNRSCKDPEYPAEEDNQDVCPPTGVQSIGICTFDPKVNCATVRTRILARKGHKVTKFVCTELGLLHGQSLLSFGMQ